jgi:hypothetical protein
LQRRINRVLHSIDHDLLLMLLLLLHLRELLLNLVLLRERGRLSLQRIVSALFLSVLLARCCGGCGRLKRWRG